jgi:hypothetical protein
MPQHPEIKTTDANFARPDNPPLPGETVQVVDPILQPDWDNQVSQLPDSVFFHSSAWARVLRDTYHYSPSYYTVSRNGQVRALLPVLEVDSWLTGRRGISLPFTDHCEPLALDRAAGDRCLKEVIELGRRRGWKYLECRGGRSLFGDAPASVTFYGHNLRLSPDIERLYDSLDCSVRRAIRKAGRSGLDFDIATSIEAVRTYYSLHCQTRQRQGLPPQSFNLFAQIHRNVIERNLGFVVIARKLHRSVAAAIFFHKGTEAIYKYAASDRSSQQMRGNDLVMWEAIKWYARGGYESLDFGRTSLANEGLRRFKQGWGTTEHKIEYFRYDLRTNGFTANGDAAHAWYNHVFRSLPITVSKLIGRLLYRHMA